MLHGKKALFGVILVLGGILGYLGLGPGQAEITPDINVNQTPLAIHGYDPVAYFTLGTPTKGKPEFSYEEDGAVFQFASADHLNLFLSDIEKYMPAYGGFCSYGVTQKQKFDIDPNAWEIVEGRLFLLLDPGTHTIWQENQGENIVTADTLWPAIRAIPAEEL